MRNPLDKESQKEDRRIRRTKRKLQEALFLTLSQKPLEKITVKELCERAGITRATFYVYFEDIPDMAEQMEQQALQLYRQACEQFWRERSTREAAERLLSKIFSFAKEHPAMMRILLRPQNMEQMLKRLPFPFDCDSLYISEKAPSCETMEGMEGRFVSAGCMAVLHHWLVGGMKIAPEKIARRTLSLFWREQERLPFPGKPLPGDEK